MSIPQKYQWALTMPAWVKVVLSKAMITRRHNGTSIKCEAQGCEVQLVPGDEVYSHTKKGRHNYYCVECGDALWL